MQKIVIKGGKRLKGKVKISGSKNATLPIIASCILTGGRHRLSNIPSLRDVHTIKEIMSLLGVKFEEEGGELIIDTGNLLSYEAPYELVRTMRASVLLLGPLIARVGRAKVAMPGGCAIGERPIDLHLKALRLMNVDMDLEGGYIVARTEGLKGAHIFFDIPTVTGTENVMMAATLAEGKTVLENAAKEPEVQDLAKALKEMGAQIEGEGTDTIVIHGVKELHPISHKVIPDRIEAGTYMIASAITRGDVVVEDCIPDHLTSLIEKLRAVGCKLQLGDKWIRVTGVEKIESVDIKTMPYPGFPTDLQAQFMALMCIAEGSSIITETIFENRFIHVSELRRMGADISIDGNQAIVRGKERLLAAPVMATDLRASASLVLAGLVAEGGNTEISRIYHLDRGYEALERKLQMLGAQIQRIDS
ncbi:MAG TPA: UDP-N-acetylglucosamine 1-carboxyvinyltransferase [Desulfobacteraceae bacterium]|nr:UDP-N-acetylglucosamine 1-carboxyvinyltransferase [Desulfobacteraceae bacterium]